ncbi:hypothetical protein [Streptomyces sp. 8N706]
MSDAWPEYVAGVLVLATGAMASAVVKAWRRRKPPRQDRDAAADSSE